MKEKIAPNADGSVSMGQYLAAKKGGKRAQVCVDLHQFTHHCKSVVRVAKNPWACYVCGKNTYTKCGIYSETLHMIGCKGPQKDTIFSQVPRSSVLRAL